MPEAHDIQVVEALAAGLAALRMEAANSNDGGSAALLARVERDLSSLPARYHALTLDNSDEGKARTAQAVNSAKAAAAQAQVNQQQLDGGFALAAAAESGRQEAVRAAAGRPLEGQRMPMTRERMEAWAKASGKKVDEHPEFEAFEEREEEERKAAAAQKQQAAKQAGGAQRR